MTAPIPPEAIAAAARAAYEYDALSNEEASDWDGHPGFHDAYHRQATAALQAALPHLTAAIVDPVLNECAQIANVREYGEYGTPFYNGARHLSKRIRLVIKQMTP